MWCAGRSWDRELGTHRQMGQAMRRYADVLWVDPPISPVTPARFTAGAPRRAWPSLTRVDESLVRLTPIALPFHSRKAMRSITAALLRAQIQWALRRLRRRPLAVVSCSLDDVLGRYGDDVLDVLYLTDDFVAGAKLMRLDTRRVEFEERSRAAPRGSRRRDLAAPGGSLALARLHATAHHRAQRRRRRRLRRSGGRRASERRGPRAPRRRPRRSAVEPDRHRASGVGARRGLLAPARRARASRNGSRSASSGCSLATACAGSALSPSRSSRRI